MKVLLVLIKDLLGIFKVRISVFFFCSKLKEVYSTLEKGIFYLYGDQDKRTIYAQYPIDNLVGVMKRQIDQKDINTISLFFIEGLDKNKKFNANQKNIKEVRLKCDNYIEVRDWLARFKSKITFKMEDYIGNSSMSNKNKYCPKKLYTSISMLEYIINDHKPVKKVEFLEKLKVIQGLTSLPGLIYIEQNKQIEKKGGSFLLTDQDEKIPLKQTNRTMLGEYKSNYLKHPETDEKLNKSIDLFQIQFK
jgi:hypothetical protein